MDFATDYSTGQAAPPQRNIQLIKQHFYQDGIINCPYIEDNNIVDNLLLIPKTIINI